MEGLTGTGTIIFKSSSDIDKSIIIKIVDTVSGITKNSIGEHTAAKKIVKITIKSTKLGYANNSAYAMYEVYDQNGNDITNDAISSNLTFQSSGGTVTGKHGLLTLTGVDFAQSGISIFTVPTTGVSYSVAERGTFEITVTDPATKISTSAKLIVIDAGSETEIVK